MCCGQLLGCVRLFVTPWTVACQAPLSMGFLTPVMNTGGGCHFLLQGIFLTSGIKPVSLASPAFAGRSFTTSTTWEVLYIVVHIPNSSFTALHASPPPPHPFPFGNHKFVFSVCDNVLITPAALWVEGRQQ